MAPEEHGPAPSRHPGDVTEELRNIHVPHAHERQRLLVRASLALTPDPAKKVPSVRDQRRL